MERLREAVIGPTEALLASRLDYEDSARKAHRVNAAVLALTGALNEPRPATQEIAALKVAGEGDKVIGAALALLPPQVHGTKGVPTLSSLQLRFHHVLHAARVASLTPEGTGVIGQAVGTAAAKLVVPSSHALTSGGNAPSSSSSAASGTVVVSPSSAAAPVVKPSPSTSPATAAAMERSLTGMIAPFFSTAKDGVSSLYSKLVGSSPSPSGSASSSPIDAAPKELKETVAAVGEVVHKATGKVKEVAAVAKERTQEVRTFNETMEKADALVQKGDLDAAVKILEALEGSPAEVARDWVEQARLRIATDRAASVARSRAIVLTASMY
jgi:Mitochondrial inner membrane protein